MNRVLAVCLFLVSWTLSAQKVELGVSGGISLYSGDLSAKEFGLFLLDYHFGGGGFIRYNPSKHFALRLGLTLTEVSATDGVSNDRVDRLLNFRSKITELGLTGEINLFRLGRNSGTIVTPYLLGGGAVLGINPQALFDGEYVDLQPLGTEGQGLPGYEEPYKLTQAALIMGGGLKFIFGQRVTLGFEIGGRRMFSDYLDDVTYQEVNYFDVLEGNGSLAARLSNPTVDDPEAGKITYRRGGKYVDWYYFSGATLSIGLGNGTGRFRRDRDMGCPVW